MELRKKNYKIVLEYDGTNYFGWQKQQNNLTIQEVVEVALCKLLNQSIKITGAGRTDKGVHATNQVANFEASVKRSLKDILNGLNALLPKDIKCKKIEIVKKNFSARFNAKKRTYIYKISNDYSVFERNMNYYVINKLNFEKMNKAAEFILQIKNFKNICKINKDNKNYFCKIYSSNWKRKSSSKIEYKIEANRFLYGMVRSLVGLMIRVGQSKLSLTEFKNILEQKSINKILYMAPANGLYLSKIKY